MALITSNSYNFQALENDELITECFERIGIAGDQITPVKLNSAKRSLNLLLLSWITKSTNLWTLKTGYLPLKTGQASYAIDNTITDILKINLRTFTRQLNGVAQSNTGQTYDGGGGGNPALAFDDISTTACTQNVANGNISYYYGVAITKQINFIGIQSNSSVNYNLIVETSNDNINWTALMTIEQAFIAGEMVWFDVKIPTNATTYRIRETGGATLNIQELFFTNNILDLPISPVSRDTYLSFSNKYIPGKPSCYYYDKQIKPVLNFWYPPTATYKVLQYSYIKVMQDVGGFYNITDVPSKMYPALICGLTWMLAVKYNPQISMDLKNEYEQTFSLATANDTENIDLTIDIDISKYYEN